MDIASGLIKASIFGLLLGIMGCFHGYNCSRGAQGVGLATTNAVVSGCILILFLIILLLSYFFLLAWTVMKHPRIEVRELKKSFDETVILDHISFKVNLGESLVIIGASGSGKSVLTKCIVGLLKPDNGDIFLDGHRMKKVLR